ncbi:TVP38/TMEM64 family protein [Jeotgalibacillus sp. S-D1]|uniref:TVP38/TMEM64 family protein n=1 Tax=Jeotgalibacillus sp. S-D1 TaxID=2552189 RepID=UPI00105A6B52|nr:VTT domain-containing protein [Jeotgalibacillus sp. S-D1]TDL31012.1 TVP38/TMEM64 family protein [Jeotgalibacillus sp. S-D1]
MEAMFNLLFTIPTWAAVVLSVASNILISIAGVIPSVAITAVNLKLFGFAGGLTVSFIGEVLGTAAAFWLYRKGFKRYVDNKSSNHPKLEKLLSIDGRQAFVTIFVLRLMPFMPSGAVTFYASMSRVPFWIFFTSSTLGKIPALAMEVYSVNQILSWTAVGKWIILLGGAAGLIYLYRRWRATVYRNNR